MDRFDGRVGIQQRVVPAYRAAFFDALAEGCPQGLSVFAGRPRPQDSIESVERLERAQLCLGQNRVLFAKGSAPLGGGLTMVWQSGLLDWLEDWQPAALIVEANPRVPSTQRAIDWMKARSRPVLGWGLGAPARPGILAQVSQAARRKYFTQFDGMITYSRQGAEEIRALGFPAERVFAAPNAVTPRPQRPAPQRLAAFNGAPVVLFVGRLQTRKRIDLLLRACAALPDKLRPHVWIVGDGPARSEFEALAREIYPRTEFFGARHGAALDPFFDMADLFVLPGTGGLAVQQAMAHALPVVVAEADGTQADLVRETNGWQTTPGDPVVLTKILEGALVDPARLRRMGAASYRIVTEEVNLEAMAAVFVRALRSTAKSLYD